MGRVGRPKKHRSVCFIEFKDDNGEKEAYVRVDKKFERLTKDNYKKIISEKGIENPYKELFSTDDDDKNDKFDEELFDKQLSLIEENQKEELKEKLKEEDTIDSFEIFAPPVNFNNEENSLLFYNDINRCQTKVENIFNFEVELKDDMNDFIMTNNEISSCSIFF